MEIFIVISHRLEVWWIEKGCWFLLFRIKDRDYWRDSQAIFSIIRHYCNFFFSKLNESFMDFYGSSDSYSSSDSIPFDLLKFLENLDWFLNLGDVDWLFVVSRKFRDLDVITMQSTLSATLAMLIPLSGSIMETTLSILFSLPPGKLAYGIRHSDLVQ